MAGRISSPVVVGRREELDWLTGVLERAVGGEAVGVILGGEAGVGKTRLVEELAAHARAHGFTAIAGGCMDLAGAALPFGPICRDSTGARP